MSEKISVKLEALTQDFNRKMDASTKVVNKVANNTKELSRNVVIAGNSLNAMKTPLAGAGQKLASFKNVLILANIQLVKMAAVMVTQGVKAMDSLVKSSFAATNATKLFNRELEVGGHGLKAGQDLVQRLSEKFNVHSSVVEDAATQLLRYGADINAVEGLLTAAGASSLAFGRDVASGFSNVAQAVMSEQSQMLNSIGIASNLSKAYRDKAKALGVTVDQLTNAQKATAAMTMTMTESAGEIEAVPVLMEGYGGASTRLAEAFTQMKISVGASLESTITGMINFATRIIEKVTLVADAVGDIKTAFQDLLDSPWLTWAKPLFSMLANVGNAIGKLLGLAGWDAFEKSHRNAIEAAQNAPAREARALSNKIDFGPLSFGSNVRATGSMELARSRQNLGNELMRAYEASTDPRNKTTGSQRALLDQLTVIRSVLVKDMQDTIARYEDDLSPKEEGRFAKQVEESEKLINALDDLERQVKTNITVIELNALETAKLTTVIDEGAGEEGGGPLVRGTPPPGQERHPFVFARDRWASPFSHPATPRAGLSMEYESQRRGGWGANTGLGAVGGLPPRRSSSQMARDKAEVKLAMSADHLAEEVADFKDARAALAAERAGQLKEAQPAAGITTLGEDAADAVMHLANLARAPILLRATGRGDIAIGEQKEARKQILGAATPSSMVGIATSNEHIAKLAEEALTAQKAAAIAFEDSMRQWETMGSKMTEAEEAAANTRVDIATAKLQEEVLFKEQRQREALALTLEQSNIAQMGYTMALGGFGSTVQQATQALKALNEEFGEPETDEEGTRESPVHTLNVFGAKIKIDQDVEFMGLLNNLANDITNGGNLVAGAFKHAAGRLEKHVVNVLQHVGNMIHPAVSAVAGGIWNVIKAFFGRIFGRRRRLRDLLEKRRASKGKRIVTPWSEDPTVNPEEFQILSAQTVGRAASQPVLSTVQIQSGQNLLIASQSLQLAADTLLSAVSHRNFASSDALRAS